MDVVQSLRAIVGNDGVLDAKETATRAAGAMRFDTLVAQALVRPKTTEQVLHQRTTAALYPRYAAFLRPETRSFSKPGAQAWA